MAKSKQNMQLVKADISPLQQFGLSGRKDELINLVFEEGVKLRALTINGVNDTAGYKAVKEGVATIKQSRVAFTKSVNESILDPAKKWVKETQKDLEEINSGMSDIEQHLRDKLEAIDNEKKRIKDEEAKAKALKIQTRIAELMKIGAEFDGIDLYKFPYNNGSISYYCVSTLSDENFASILEEFIESYTIQQQMLLEERLKREQEEAESLALQAKLEQQAKELKERITNFRIKELKSYGLSWQDVGRYSLNGRISSESEIGEMTDGEWDAELWDITRKENGTTVLPPNIDTIVDNEVQEHVESVKIEHPLDVYYEMQESFAVADDIIVSMTFNSIEPYIDTIVGKKSVQRIYPPAYKELARKGIEEKNIIEQGELYEGLLFVVFKK